MSKLPVAPVPDRRLSAYVAVPRPLPRSVNLERDYASGSDSYIPAGRALELLGRISAAMGEPRAGRAWSVTGPYGSGKSSFALFLDALTGPAGDPGRASAEAALMDADPALYETIVAGRKGCGADRDGFIRALVTAQQEPVSTTILRGLSAGARRFWPGRKGPRPVRRQLADLLSQSNRGVRADVSEIMAVVTELATAAPLLVVIDEFGKNLESWSASASGSDLFVLQQLAEKGWGTRGVPVFFLTLQHLAFEDYSGVGSEANRKELIKVQGRFEDVPFVDSPAVGARLIRKSLGAGPEGNALVADLNTYADAALRDCDHLNLTPVLDADVALLSETYPLHPVSLAVLPELCARYAQNHRTLFTFLSSGEPGSLRTFLECNRAAPGGVLPLYTCDQVYDYFVQSAGGVMAGGAQASRWLEVERRVREAAGLDEDDVRCLKTIGLLNLVATAGSLRASPELVAFAMTMPGSTKKAKDLVAARLRRLDQGGFITYRSFSDEYRMWQGSDFDIASAVGAATEEVTRRSLASLLAELNPLTPMVAARHSQGRGILRYFQRLLADDAGLAEPILPEADGYVIYFLGTDEAVVRDQVRDLQRPLVLVRAPDLQSIANVATEAAALAEVLTAAALKDDWVARREVQERVAIARERVRNQFAEVFAAERDDLTWSVTGRREINARQGLSRLLSDICDRIYSDSPTVQNEMIARAELTSQGASARRELIEAMILHQEAPTLNLEGYGPERAMYEALLAFPGIHGMGPDGILRFQPPRRNSTFGSVWRAIDETLDQAQTEAVTAAELAEVLKSPPYGIKDGLIPVLTTAALLWRSEDVAVYQDGTYQAAMTPDLVERMVKVPDRFSFRCFTVKGFRLDIVEGLARVFGGPSGRYRHRNATILSAAVPLIEIGRNLPPYTQRTQKLSAMAQAVREELLIAREPDQLLFEALPRACGIDRLRQRGSGKEAAVAEFLLLLEGATVELQRAYERLLERIREALAFNLSVPDHVDLRPDVRARALRLMPEVLDKRLKSFLWIAGDATLDEGDWVEAIAMNLTEKPPTTWRDDDELLFESSLREVAGTLARVEALHFEQRDSPREGFDAKRIAVTAADGGEVSRVVWIDPKTAEALVDVLDKAIAGSSERMGTAGPDALLALLAERIYSDADVTTEMETKSK